MNNLTLLKNDLKFQVYHTAEALNYRKFDFSILFFDLIIDSIYYSDCRPFRAYVAR